ncbi:hypothetical protein PRIPAC_85320 [Pristionchus pacificus]|uniref:Uncharacterized protein n=1 Tax=Pristionchus pacificus TaxID=54126 RepID=A0A2A6BML5_PRIPA|nr:hypothetical protein PRIPAC_85320 [Pristionchus pacificus]|eukprot:PDM67139.1 hypothetical protein PRIPAC_48556 [Pristionchus pacificus]
MFRSALGSLRAGDGQWSKKREAAISPKCLLIPRTLAVALARTLSNIISERLPLLRQTKTVLSVSRVVTQQSYPAALTRATTASERLPCRLPGFPEMPKFPDMPAFPSYPNNGNSNSAGSHNNVPPGSVVHSTNTVNGKKREAEEKAFYSSCKCSVKCYPHQCIDVCKRCDDSGCTNGKSRNNCNRWSSYVFSCNGKREAEYLERLRRSIEQRR